MTKDKNNMLFPIIFLISFIIILLCKTSLNSSNSESLNKLSYKTYSINDKKTLKIQNINKIYIDGKVSKINIISEDRDNVNLSLNGTIKSNFKPYLNSEFKGNSLFIYTNNKNLTSYSIVNNDLKLNVSIPKNYNKNLKINFYSGDLNIDNMLSLDNLDLNFSSGNCFIKDICTNNFNINFSSGNVIIENLKSLKSTLKFSSGKAKFKNMTGDLKGDFSSGSFYIDYSSFKNNVNINSSSGNILLHLPKNSDFLLNSSTSSGSINCDFPIKIKKKNKTTLNGILKNNKNKINIKTSSGNITVGS